MSLVTDFTAKLMTSLFFLTLGIGRDIMRVTISHSGYAPVKAIFIGKIFPETPHIARYGGTACVGVVKSRDFLFYGESAGVTD